MDHHLTFLQLLELLCTPSSTIAVRQRLSKLTEEHDLSLPLSASKNLERGVINLEGGASAPLAPPLNPPLQCAMVLASKFNPIQSYLANHSYEKQVDVVLLLKTRCLARLIIHACILHTVYYNIVFKFVL